MPASGSDWLNIVSIVGGLVIGSGMASMIVALIAMYKARSERKKTIADADLVEAETTEKYQLIADRAADRALKLDDRIKHLESTVQQQQLEIGALQCENQLLRTDHQKLADDFDHVLIGAHMLHDQVIEMNGEPRYEPPERRKKIR